MLINIIHFQDRRDYNRISSLIFTAKAGEVVQTKICGAVEVVIVKKWVLKPKYY
jgi:hypothetical protein|tara:strand:+ start:288 stop:449 length:162 start_codon:yes stop_codon:yes gene_type:complete